MKNCNEYGNSFLVGKGGPDSRIDERGGIRGGITLQAIPDGEFGPVSTEELMVKDVMTEAFPVVGRDTRLVTISAILQREPAVLVAEKGKLIGIITKYDLVNNMFGPSDS